MGDTNFVQDGRASRGQGLDGHPGFRAPPRGSVAWPSTRTTIIGPASQAPMPAPTLRASYPIVRSLPGGTATGYTPQPSSALIYNEHRLPPPADISPGPCTDGNFEQRKLKRAREYTFWECVRRCDVVYAIVLAGKDRNSAAPAYPSRDAGNPTCVRHYPRNAPASLRAI